MRVDDECCCCLLVCLVWSFFFAVACCCLLCFMSFSFSCCGFHVFFCFLNVFFFLLLSAFFTCFCLMLLCCCFLMMLCCCFFSLLLSDVAGVSCLLRGHDCASVPVPCCGSVNLLFVCVRTQPHAQAGTTLWTHRDLNVHTSVFENAAKV